MSTLRPYIYILAAVVILFSLIHGCAGIKQAAFIQQLSGSSTPASETATSPMPLSADEKAHLKRLNAKRKVVRESVQRFSAAMADNADQLADHIKLIRAYLAEPHYDDSVWQENIRTEARATEDGAQSFRTISPVPQPCRTAYRLYLSALDLDHAAAHTIPKALDTQHDDWIQESLKKFDQAAEKLQYASDQVKAVDAELAVEKETLD